MKVLIIDGDITNQKELKTRLMKDGHDICNAEDGQ